MWHTALSNNEWVESLKLWDSQRAFYMEDISIRATCLDGCMLPFRFSGGMPLNTSCRGAMREEGMMEDLFSFIYCLSFQVVKGVHKMNKLINKNH